MIDCPSHDPSMAPDSLDGSPPSNRPVSFEVHPGLPLEGKDGSPPEYSDTTSSESTSRALPHRAASFFQNASNFTMDHANFNNNLHIVTINLDRFHDGRASYVGGQCRSPAALSSPHSQDCACTLRSSHVVASLNTPTQQLRFEFSQQEIGLNRPKGQVPIDRGHIHVTPQFNALPQQREAELLAEEQATDECLKRLSMTLDGAVVSMGKGRHRGKEEPCHTPGPPTQKPWRIAMAEPRHGLGVREALVTIFGKEDSRGVYSSLRNFTFFRHTAAGESNGQLVRLRSRFLPHYNGLSREIIARLNTPVKVTIARVVEDLRRERRASGLGQPLTFETVQSRLSQLVFLQTSSGDATTSLRVVKCNRGSRVAPILTDAAQYIIRVMESDEPDSILDEAFTIPKTRKGKRGDKPRLPSGEIGTSRTEGTAGLVDLTVLCFPQTNVPRFKLCHLLIKCFASKEGGLTPKAEVGAIVEYTSHFYHIREGVIPRLTSEVTNEAIICTENLFPI